MRLSSLSVFAALMLLQSDCSVDISALPDDMLALVLSNVPSDLGLHTTSKLFRCCMETRITRKVTQDEGEHVVRERGNVD